MPQVRCAPLHLLLSGAQREMVRSWLVMSRQQCYTDWDEESGETEQFVSCDHCAGTLYCHLKSRRWEHHLMILVTRLECHPVFLSWPPPHPMACVQRAVTVRPGQQWSWHQPIRGQYATLSANQSRDHCHRFTVIWSAPTLTVNRLLMKTL